MTQRTTDGTYVKGSWSLDDLIPTASGPEMDLAFAEVEAAAAALELMRPALVPEIEEATFVEILGLVERHALADLRLDTYAGMRFFEDMRDQDALAFLDCVETALAAAKNRTLFFDLWWKALDGANAKRLLKIAGDVAYYLETLRSSAPYTLTEVEERVINLKNVNGADALVTLYRTITNGFAFDVEVDGETTPLSRSEIMVLGRDASPALRETAYRSMLGVYGSHREVLAQIYKHIAADWHAENVDLRRMASPISVRNVENDVPDDAVAVLLETCRENVGIFHRYFGLKAKWLGLERLRRFDVYAPLEEAEDEVPFPEGVGLVLDAFRAFSPKLADLAQRVLDEGHLDSECRPGKRSGALSADAMPGVTPWVLVNYGDRAADATTLAHELGHAVHALMAADHSVLTFSPPLPLAETASSFAQMLLMDGMVERDEDPLLRRAVLARYVEDSYTAIPRQAFFVLFEQEAHRMIAGGATADGLCAAYMANLRAQFGDSLEVDEIFQYEWLAHPHLFTMPFYDYAYAFGHLLVLSLFQRYKEEGDAFVPGYLKTLAYGGSTSPTDILDEAGFDIRAKGFWQGGFDVLAGMVDELEELA